MREFVEMKYVNQRSSTEIRDKLNISRRNYDRAKKMIEEARDMESVKWVERYIVDKNE